MRNIGMNQAVLEVTFQPLSSRCAIKACCSRSGEPHMSLQVPHFPYLLTAATGRPAFGDPCPPLPVADTSRALPGPSLVIHRI